MKRSRLLNRSLVGLSAALMLGLGCSKDDGEQKNVRIDGSSTVLPISELAAEMFHEKSPEIRVTVAYSGTGGGFKKFLDKDPILRTDINDASRPIKDSEMETAKKLGVEFIEIPIALDGIAVIVNPKNDFCNDLTVDELKKMWSPGSEVNNWNQVREGFPDLELKLYGPGHDSGTFDYFTEVIVGKEGSSREDYNPNEDDNMLVTGVAGAPGALGYFGYSYYEANKDKLKLVAIDNNEGNPVKPTIDLIRAGKYEPLSRPLFLYVNKASLARDEVKSFLDFYLDNAPKIVEDKHVNYVALSDELYGIAKARLSGGVTGSAIAKASESEEKQELTDIYAITK